MHQEMDMTWDVQGVDDKDGRSRDQAEVRPHENEDDDARWRFEYDSKSETAPTGLGAMIAPMYKAMTNGEFEITMTARGEVKDVKIPEEVLDGAEVSPGAAAMGDIASAEGFKKMISQGALVLPEDAPKEGDTGRPKSR